MAATSARVDAHDVIVRIEVDQRSVVGCPTDDDQTNNDGTSTRCGSNVARDGPHLASMVPVAKRATAQTVSDLTAAMEHAPLVRVTRGDRLPSVSGWVVDVGIRWCILVDEQAAMTGRYTALRLRDVTSVRTKDRPTPDDGLRNTRVAMPVGVDATSTGPLLTTAVEVFGSVALHLERRTRTRTYTGRVVWIADKRVTIGVVDPTTFSPRPAVAVRFRDITRVEFG